MSIIHQSFLSKSSIISDENAFFSDIFDSLLSDCRIN